MSEEKLNDELAAVEAALGSVGPGPSRLDRDRVMYLAGRASLAEAPVVPPHGSRRWGWPAAFSAMTAVAGALLVMLVAREPGPRVVQVVQPPQPTPDVADKAAGPQQKEALHAPAIDEEPSRLTIWDARPTVDRDRSPPLRPTPYGRQLSMVLAQAFNGPSGSLPSPTGPRKHLSRPVPYRELLDRVSEEAAPGAVFRRPRKDVLFPQGADS